MKSFYDCVTGQGDVPMDYKPGGTLSLEKAFQVYQNGYIARLTEALGDTFENVWKVVGDDLFFEIAKNFIRQTPSESYNLGDYSPRFASFLQNHSISEEFPFLPDLALLGWLKKESFNAPMETGLTGEALLNILSDNGTALFTSHFHLQWSEYSLLEISFALTENQEPPETWENPQGLVIYKSNNSVFVEKLGKASFITLKKIEKGEPLLKACEDLPEKDLTALFHFLAKNALLK